MSNEKMTEDCIIKTYSTKEEYEKDSKALAEKGFVVANEIGFDRGTPEEALQVEYERQGERHAKRQAITITV